MRAARCGGQPRSTSAEQRVEVHPAVARDLLGEGGVEPGRAEAPPAPGGDVVVAGAERSVGHRTGLCVDARRILTCESHAPMRPLSSPTRENRLLGLVRARNRLLLRGRGRGAEPDRGGGRDRRRGRARRRHRIRGADPQVRARRPRPRGPRRPTSARSRARTRGGSCGRSPPRSPCSSPSRPSRAGARPARGHRARRRDRAARHEPLARALGGRQQDRRSSASGRASGRCTSRGLRRGR